MQDLHLPALNRDDLLPRRPAGMGKGFAMAIAAHVLLVVALTLSVNWSSSDPAGVEAELWSAVPQIAAQRAAPLEPAEPTPPKPELKPEPPKPVEAPPPPKPAPDPQIAIEKEKARKEKEKQEKLREQQEQERKDKLEKQKRDAEEKKREAEDKKAEERKLAEKKKQDAAREAQLQAQRDAQLKRIQAMAGADNGSPSGQGTVTSGPSSTYGGRIRAAVEPNITFTNELSGNPAAEVEVRQGPDGTITGSRLVKSSGVKEWDDAVLRAIDKTQKLPRDIDGRVISPFVIVFRPNK